MLLFQAIVLGLIQGLTEFLPVSSSGHLQGVPYLVGWEGGSVAFDVMVHTGTLVAVVWYFKADLWYLATRTVGVADATAEVRHARRTVALLAVGSVPAAVAGLLFQDTFEAAFDSPRMVAGFLYVTALLLVLAERVRKARAARQLGVPAKQLGRREAALDPGRHEGTITFVDALVIGCAQALAIFPGISRSGATIVAGMVRGLSRAGAARFSFLLSIPAIIGATIVTLPDLGDHAPGSAPFSNVDIAAGVLVAAASGYWAIRYLLRLVVRDDLLGFARYVAFFATLLLAGTFWIG